MVLDITRVSLILRSGVFSVSGEFSLEFIKDLFERFADDVAENVHAATMRHADDNLRYTVVN